MGAMWAVRDFPWWHFLVRAVIVYVAVILLLRIGGKRQVGQLGMAQFVGLILLGNAVQNALNGGDNSVTGGLILAVTLIALTYLFTFATQRSKTLRNLLQGRPTHLVRSGRVQHHHLRREHMTLHELRVLLREQGVRDLHELRQEVDEAILESDGKLSVCRRCETDAVRELHAEHEGQPAGQAQG